MSDIKIVRYPNQDSEHRVHLKSIGINGENILRIWLTNKHNEKLLFDEFIVDPLRDGESWDTCYKGIIPPLNNILEVNLTLEYPCNGYEAYFMPVWLEWHKDGR